MRSVLVSLSAMTRTSLALVPTPPGNVKVAAAAPGGELVVVVVEEDDGWYWPRGVLPIWAGRAPGASDGAVVVLLRREEKRFPMRSARFSALPLRTWYT